MKYLILSTLILSGCTTVKTECSEPKYKIEIEIKHITNTRFA